SVLTYSLTYCLYCAYVLLTYFPSFLLFFFFNDTATTELYTLSLHDALPILTGAVLLALSALAPARWAIAGAMLLAAQMCVNAVRSEEHTSELQSPCNLVCRLLLEKKKNKKNRMNK